MIKAEVRLISINKQKQKKKKPKKIKIIKKLFVML